MKNNYYIHRALLYAEKYGIIEYSIRTNRMFYRTQSLMENRKYVCVVNLDTYDEKRICY